VSLLRDHGQRLVYVHGDGVSRRIATDMKGNVGTGLRRTTAAFTAMQSTIARLDKSLASGSENLTWVNGVEPAWVTVTNSENTNSFGNSVRNIGSRNDGAGVPTAMDLAQYVEFGSRLTDAQTTALDRALRDIAGVA
jgi:hypothetical protein